MGFSSPGIGSGLPIKELVEATVKAETVLKQKHLDDRVKHIQTEFSAIGQIKSQLDNLKATVAKLADITKCYNMKSNTTDPSFFSTVLSPSAPAGVYKISVQELAQQQTLASTYYTKSSDSIGSGNLTINFGTYNADNTAFTPNTESMPLVLDISPENDSLEAICDAINLAKKDVIATVVEDSQGTRLTLTSKNTGLDYAMQITGDISALNYDPTTANTALTQTQAAKNSSVSINGLVVNQSTNKIENALPGITLNLQKQDANTTVTLVVDSNKDQLSNLINDFLKQYNESMTLLTNITGYNAETQQSGYLQGDAQLRDIKSKLNKWAVGPSFNSGPLQSLGDLGIKTNKDGFLEVDQKKFQAALDKNYENIGAVFTNGSPTADASKHETKSTAGIAFLLNNFLDSSIGSKGGLTERTNKLTKEIKNIPADQKVIDKLSKALEDKYLKKYTALDVLVSKLQASSNTLTNLIGNLPKMSKD
jgi:flagellar hook-associated protein 2